MKANLILIALLLTVATVTSCKENLVNDNSGKTGNNWQEEKNNLTGTKWKLVGFFDVERNNLEEAEPKDCDECYTLAFDTDSTFSGQSANNFLISALSIYKIDYKTGKFNFINIGGTERGEIGHGYIYVETLWKVNSFTVESTYPRELHLWYNDGKNYLKYKETGGSNEN